VCRVYNCSAAKGKQAKIFARANHPSAEGCADLMTLKIKDLKTRAKTRKVLITSAFRVITLCFFANLLQKLTTSSTFSKVVRPVKRDEIG
jgi:hypothetical protein